MTEAELAQALEALRQGCDSLGRGISQEEYEDFCAAHRLGRPWRRWHLTRPQHRSGRLGHRWADLLARVGHTLSPLRYLGAATRSRRQAPPGARRCQNAPDCRRTPPPGYRFCKGCRNTWDHYAMDCGVAGLPPRGR